MKGHALKRTWSLVSTLQQTIVMADPKWEERFRPVMSAAVEVLSNLLSPSSNFEDKLIEAELVTFQQMKDVKRARENYGDEEGARSLFGTLRRRPRDSFNTFCRVLQEVPQGQDLLVHIAPERSSLESSTEVQSPKSVSSVGLTANSKSEECTPVQSRDQSLAGCFDQLDCDREACRGYQAAFWAGREMKEALSMQPYLETYAAETDSDSAETNSDSDSDAKTIITVQVLRKYKKVYKKHKAGVRSTIKRVFQKVFNKKGVKVDETYPKKLYRSSAPTNFRLSVTDTVAFKIIFPKLRHHQRFEPHRQRIVRDLSGTIGVPEDQVEICVSAGSCVLSVKIPGDGFICFLAALGVPGRLDFLYTVDAEVIVKIEELFEITLEKLHDRQDEDK